MRRNFFFGALMVLTAMLMLSCNKNRFEMDNLDSVEGSGQWKLPLGSLDVTLGDVLKQFDENEWISYDENGNLQISRSIELKNIIKGSTFLSLGTLNAHADFSFENPFPGVTILDPIAGTWNFQQPIKIYADSASIETAVVKSGTLLVDFHNNNLGIIDSIAISSPDITMGDGDTLYAVTYNEQKEIDLAGTSFSMHNLADSTLNLNYSVYYKLTGSDVPVYEMTTVLGLNNLKLKELSGYVNAFSYDFSADTTFSLPLDNLSGELSLVGTTLTIKEKNTFDGLNAKLEINTAELYGGSAQPSNFFDHYPFVLEIDPSSAYHNVLDNEPIGLTYNTEYDAIRFKGSVGFNPAASTGLVVVRDTSAISLGVEAVVPMQFNIPNVAYVDTIDLNTGDILTPSLVQEILLSAIFKSQMPFTLDAQFYTYNSTTGTITGELFENPLMIPGSYNDQPTISEAEISLTNASIKRLMEADKLILNCGVRTDGHDVVLNLENSFGVTLKADVIYDGTINVND